MVTRPLQQERLQVVRTLAVAQLRDHSEPLVAGVVREVQRSFGIRSYEPEAEGGIS